MDNYVDIAIIGDYNGNFTSHIASNRAIEQSATFLDVEINFWWVDTRSVAEDPKNELSRYDGIMVAPGPYGVARGVIEAIRYARENNVPFLGTSGGCQFMILEFTRNVLGVSEASSFFSAEGKGVITRKDASNQPQLEMEKIYLMNGSIAHDCYPQEITREASAKKLNITGELLDYLAQAGLRPAGIDDEGDVRIFEYTKNDFFIGTLFHPQLTSAGALPHPLINNFIKHAHRFRQSALDPVDAIAV